MANNNKTRMVFFKFFCFFNIFLFFSTNIVFPSKDTRAIVPCNFLFSQMFMYDVITKKDYYSFEDVYNKMCFIIENRNEMGLHFLVDATDSINPFFCEVKNEKLKELEMFIGLAGTDPNVSISGQTAKEKAVITQNKISEMLLDEVFNEVPNYKKGLNYFIYEEEVTKYGYNLSDILDCVLNSRVYLKSLHFLIDVLRIENPFFIIDSNIHLLKQFDFLEIIKQFNLDEKICLTALYDAVKYESPIALILFIDFFGINLDKKDKDVLCELACEMGNQDIFEILNGDIDFRKRYLVIFKEKQNKLNSTRKQKQVQYKKENSKINLA